MAELAVLLRAAVLLTAMVAAGAAIARSQRREVDCFAVVWWGLATVSIAGVVLARAGRFSLPALACAVGGTAVGAWLIGAARAREAPDTAPPSPATRRVRWIACAAGAVAIGWTWPPFETFMAAADSTMYVDAGIHLARTSSYEVPTSISRVLPVDLAHALFASIGIVDQGPYLRLPGGLLMPTREATSATPAFFPLLPTWTGVLAAIGGPSLAPAVAPFATALAVWALTLFTGECFGVVAALATAIVFLGNFAVWWFGRFPMSEPLTVAFVWGGLVLLARGAPFAAGVMLGIGGVARAETLLFVVAAVCWWAAWTTVRARDVLGLVVGVALVGWLAAVGLFGSPNHHVAYLLNDLAFAWTRLVVRILPALWDGRILVALVLMPTLPIAVGVAAAWRGRPPFRTAARVVLGVGVGIAMLLYLRLGGRAEPLRHLGWLAGSMSPLGLVLAVVGTLLVWSRGGSAARLAVILVLFVAAVFVPSPRVANYQPWAMRRFLPVVLPGLSLAAGVSVAAIFASPRRWARIASVLLLAAVVAMQVRPIFAVRDAGYFARGLASVQQIANAFPPNAVVVVDGSLADLQIQVPLWLVFGRETAMASGGGPAWRDLLSRLVEQGRPVYWIQNRYAARPDAPGLVFTTIAANADFTINLPNSPADEPPAFVMQKVVPLALYGVAAGEG